MSKQLQAEIREAILATHNGRLSLDEVVTYYGNKFSVKDRATLRDLIFQTRLGFASFDDVFAHISK